MKIYRYIFFAILAMFGHHNGNLCSMIDQKHETHESDVVHDLIRHACLGNYQALSNFLLNNPDTDVNTTMSNGGTALHIACHEGHSRCVELLLKHEKINVNHATDEGLTPLLLACFNGRTDCVNLLLNHPDVLVNQTEVINDRSPLFIACQNGHFECVQLLLNNKRTLIDQVNKIGATPLSIACQKGYTACVKLLLENGADGDKAIIDDNTTPLFIACQEGHLECVKLLLENNVDINEAQIDGTTPLFMASQEGHLACVKLLLQNGANINKAQADGMTPLAVACQSKQYHCLQFLIEHLINSKNLSEEEKDSIFRNYYEKYQKNFSLHATELACYLTKIFDAGFEEVIINQLDNDDTCGICQDSFSESLNENPFVVQLACEHVFHETCSRSWAKSGRTNGAYCPLCRKNNVNKLGQRTIKFLVDSKPNRNDIN